MGFRCFPRLSPGPASCKMKRFYRNRVTSLLLLPPQLPLEHAQCEPWLWLNYLRAVTGCTYGTMNAVPDELQLFVFGRRKKRLWPELEDLPCVLRDPRLSVGSWRMLACLARGNLLDILQEGFTEVNACPRSRTDPAGGRQHAFVQELLCLPVLWGAEKEKNEQGFRVGGLLTNRRTYRAAQPGLCNEAVVFWRVCGWFAAGVFILFSLLYCCSSK